MSNKNNRMKRPGAINRAMALYALAGYSCYQPVHTAKGRKLTIPSYLDTWFVSKIMRCSRPTAYRALKEGERLGFWKKDGFVEFQGDRYLWQPMQVSPADEGIFMLAIETVFGPVVFSGDVQLQVGRQYLPMWLGYNTEVTS